MRAYNRDLAFLGVGVEDAMVREDLMESDSSCAFCLLEDSILHASFQFPSLD